MTVTTTPTPETTTIDSAAPGGYFTMLLDGREGACAVGALVKHRTGSAWPPGGVEESCGLDDDFINGVIYGFDGDLVDDGPRLNILYRQGHAVGQRVRELMGVTA